MHGYRNVIFRLIYTYGDQASYRLRSREGQWTNLSLIFPDHLDNGGTDPEKGVEKA